MPFDPQFEINPIYTCASAAYIAMGVPTPPLALPPGFALAGLITANPQHAAPHMATADPHQQRIALKSLMESSIFGLLAWDDATKTAIVAFRGTETIWDWIDDVDAVPVPFIPDPSAGRVHMGFQLVYVSVRSSMADLLNQHAAGAQRIMVTGHSLGGALAELAALDISRTLHLPVTPEVYTLAGPRVGAPEWAPAFNSAIRTCSRVVNFGDLVPQVPLPPLYEHVGTEVMVHRGFRVTDVSFAHHLTTYLIGLQKLAAPAPAAESASTTTP